jgi:hypothetical protein
VVSGRVASGSLGQFVLSSGAVNSGQVGNAAVVSGSIASGAVGTVHVSSGGLGSGAIGSGQIFTLHVASGGLLSGAIGSGQIGQFHVSSGAITSGTLGVTGGAPDGTKVLRDDFTWTTLASGFVPSYTSGAVLSGTIASGQIGTFHFTSGAIITYARNAISDDFIAEEAISGLVAVAIGSGGVGLVRAQPGSGLRMPAVGISVLNVVSGATAQFIANGKLLVSASGAIAGSGFNGLNALAYVGSGGLLLTKSGYVTGASSGGGPGVAGTSGRVTQRVGVWISGGILVKVDNYMTSGLITLAGVAQ